MRASVFTIAYELKCNEHIDWREKQVIEDAIEKVLGKKSKVYSATERDIISTVLDPVGTRRRARLQEHRTKAERRNKTPYIQSAIAARVDDIFCRLPDYIFANLSKEYKLASFGLRVKFVPFDNDGLKLIFDCSKMEHKRTKQGRVWITAHKPRGAWTKKLGLSTHALERIVERYPEYFLRSTTAHETYTNTYLHYATINAHPLLLDTTDCPSNMYRYYIGGIPLDSMENDQGVNYELYLLGGYLATEQHDDMLVGLTYLLPGYLNTPEHRKLGHNPSQEAIDALTENYLGCLVAPNFHRLLTTDQMDKIRDNELAKEQADIKPKPVNRVFNNAIQSLKTSTRSKV